MANVTIHADNVSIERYHFPKTILRKEFWTVRIVSDTDTVEIISTYRDILDQFPGPVMEAD